MTLRLATYNIHGCIGRDGRHDPARIRSVLHGLDADVVALQEVQVPDRHPGLLEFLCEKTRWQPVHGPTMARDDGQYGNAVLTSLPIQALEHIDISHPRREPRGALLLCLTAAGHRLDLLATHLGLRPGERRSQIRRLLNEVHARKQGDSPADCTVLAGDLNEWLAWGRPLRWLRSHFGPAMAHATWPSQRPLLALDRVWVRPKSVLTKTTVVNTALAREASDHLPLLAELDLGVLQTAGEAT